MTNEVLTFLGYDVVFAQDGAAAVELYKREKEAGVPFDIVILDLSVPEGMGGKEAMQNLREYDPAVKAIVSSGYGNDPAVTAFADYGFSAKLTKPYKITDLKATLEELLKQ